MAHFDMDEFTPAEARRMHPARLADRHPLLDPEQGLARRQLGQQEAGPAAIAGAGSEQFAKRWLDWLGQAKWLGQT